MLLIKILNFSNVHHISNKTSRHVHVPACLLWKIDKTRGLRRWPKRETIELRCNKLYPGSTEIFAIKVRNLDLSGKIVKTSRNVSIKIRKDISSGAGDIPIFAIVIEEVSQLTD